MNHNLVSRGQGSVANGHWLRCGWLAGTVGLFLVLAGHQLGLPGLHYDEAKEAGVNAMELLHGAPLSAFREATVSLFGVELPLMVQDYIGALNVYVVLPFLATSGIGVPNLRVAALLLAVLGLLTLERTISEWLALTESHAAPITPITPLALVCLTLLVLGPSFVFWQRQGIFVTNATFPLTFACIWQGIRWLRLGQGHALLLAAFCAGFALYAKLLAAWIVLPFGLGCAGWWVWRKTTSIRAPLLTLPLLLAATLAFLAPLVPLFLFNVQTSGTIESITQNLSSSYYGVHNAAIWSNAAIRWQQLLQTLDGSHFWYLGSSQQNPLAPKLALALPIMALVRPSSRRLIGPPLLLLTMAFVGSLFTVSDLFITHYALLQPLAVTVAGIGLYELWRWPASRAAFRLLFIALMCAWVLLDLRATTVYHSALARSGGLADHSDATYHLAFDLRYGGLGAPLALDWGLDAPVRFLSAGTVRPIEIFGYDSLAEPDDGFAQRLAPFLDNPHNVYLLRAAGNELFRGRRAVFERLVAERNGHLTLEEVYTQRDGTPLYERWRISY